MKIYVGTRGRLLIACAIVVNACLLAGCSGGGGLFSGGTDASLTVRNQATERFIKPELTGVAYSNRDETSADLFLTDLPVERLADPAANLDGLTGSLVHVHLFLVPSAGDTPIGATACNVTVRMLMLVGDGEAQAGGVGGTEAGRAGALDGVGVTTHAGLYNGAGFVLPSGDPGDGTYGGSMFGASLRLSAATGGFSDPLSPAEMQGSFRAPLKPELAHALLARMNRVAGALGSSGRASAGE